MFPTTTSKSVEIQTEIPCRDHSFSSGNDKRSRLVDVHNLPSSLISSVRKQVANYYTDGIYNKIINCNWFSSCLFVT